MEWFCASEAFLNTLFNIRTRNAPEYSKYFIGELVKKLYNVNAEGQANEQMDFEEHEQNVIGLEDEN